MRSPHLLFAAVLASACAAHGAAAALHREDGAVDGSFDEPRRETTIRADGGGLCSSGAGCFWNGRCADSACVCSAAWTGANCNVLAELETVQLWPDPAQPLPADALVTDAWGVTVAQDAATGRFWLYACVACLFSNGVPQNFSMHNSGIIAASAPALEGPYRYEGEFEGIFSEGPQMTRAPDGQYVLITPSQNSSSAGPVLCTGAYANERARSRPTRKRSRDAMRARSRGSGGARGGRAQARGGSVAGAGAGAGAFSPPRFGSVVNKSSIFSAPSPAGPWTTHRFNVSETSSLGYFSNPSLSIDASGAGSLVFRVNLQPPVGSGETIGFATSPAWGGPLYTAIAEPIMPGLVGYEDPFVWAHTELAPSGASVTVLSVLTHTQTRSAGVGGLFVSDDGGLTWVLSPVPAYNLTVSVTSPGWPSGATQLLRRERPSLLFAADGSISHLLTGAMLGGRGPAGAWQLSYSIMTRIGKA